LRTPSLALNWRPFRHWTASENRAFDATSGLRSLREVPVLRVLAAMFALTNLGLLFGQGIFVKFASVELGLGPYGYGALLVALAAS
ncbi:MAG: hypothetical protein ACO38D_11375, partial [Ilumatobacteraceae bacterium]